MNFLIFYAKFIGTVFEKYFLFAWACGVGYVLIAFLLGHLKTKARVDWGFVGKTALIIPLQLSIGFLLLVPCMLFPFYLVSYLSGDFKVPQ
jgi:hypothetical protein